MGLGKTLQVISFVDVFLRLTNAHCVLIIVPVNTLQNWVAEFDMWLPVSQSAGCCGTGESDSEKICSRSFSLYILNENMKTNVARARVVCEYEFQYFQLHWVTGDTILLRVTLLKMLFNIRLIGKFVMKLSLNILPHIRHVASLHDDVSIFISM